MPLRAHNSNFSSMSSCVFNFFFKNIYAILVFRYVNSDRFRRLGNQLSKLLATDFLQSAPVHSRSVLGFWQRSSFFYCQLNTKLFTIISHSISSSCIRRYASPDRTFLCPRPETRRGTANSPDRTNSAITSYDYFCATSSANSGFPSSCNASPAIPTTRLVWSDG